MRGIQPEIVTLNGRQHWALVDRLQRQITVKGDVPIVLTDTIAARGMTGAIDGVELGEGCTVVRLGDASEQPTRAKDAKG